MRYLLLEQNRRQEDWDELLLHIIRSFRATPNSTTRETVNFMMMSRECTLPDTLLYDNEVEPPMSSTDNVALLQSRMQEAHDLLRTQQHTGTIIETEDLLYKVGDLVLVDSRQRRKRVNPKLQAQFVGPFRVSKAYCNHTYRLDGYQSLVSQSRLKLYHDFPSTKITLSQHCHSVSFMLWQYLKLTLSQSKNVWFCNRCDNLVT